MKSVFDDELQHHGIKGQRWGVRRFQNEDGSLTSAGERRYNSNGSGAAKPNGARNPVYTLGSAKAKKRGSGLGTGSVGSRGEGFVGGGGGHSYGTSGGGGSSSGSQGAGREKDKEPQPIGSDEWWKWYENTDQRELAEMHYNMVIAKDSRDKKRNNRGNIHTDKATEYAKYKHTDAGWGTKELEEVRKYNAGLNQRKADHRNNQREFQKKQNSVAGKTVTAVKKAASAGKSFVKKLFGG